jgi:hypothetical protein
MALGNREAVSAQGHAQHGNAERRTLAARLAQAVAPSSWMDDISVSKGSDGGLRPEPAKQQALQFREALISLI